MNFKDLMIIISRHLAHTYSWYT